MVTATEQTAQPIIIAGYICGDYHYKEDLNHFRRQFPNLDFLPENTRIYQDGKVSILPGTAERFLMFLGNEAGELVAKDVIPGGGGENSRRAFNNLRVKNRYTDTCARPSFHLEGLDPKTAYFAGICQASASLVVPVNSEGEGAGTFIIKSGRGDINQYIDREVKEEIRALLRSGNDVLTNSISNEHLAEILAHNTQGDLYTVVTTYLKKESLALGDLMRRSRVNFLSLKEFYWLIGKEDRLKHFKRGISHKNIDPLREDVVGFSKQKMLDGTLVITLGQHGAIHYHRGQGEKATWTYLLKPQRDAIQESLLERNKSTNSAGDNFAAATTQELRKGKSLEEAIEQGCRFAIKNVLKYREKINGDFRVDTV